jgi:hypothetical protein
MLALGGRSRASPYSLDSPMRETTPSVQEEEGGGRRRRGTLRRVRGHRRVRLRLGSTKASVRCARASDGPSSAMVVPVARYIGRDK